MPSDNDLHKAAHKGDIEECQRLVEDPAEPIDVNEPGASDRRPLHRAAGSGHKEICEYFLDKGALIDAIDKSGRTALIWAAIAGHTEVVKYLLSKGANILAASSNKMNSLHASCEAGKVETVRALMEHVQADEATKTELTNAKNADDKNPWEIAVGASNKAVCQVLKDMGDKNGESSSCIIF